MSSSYQRPGIIVNRTSEPLSWRALAALSPLFLSGCVMASTQHTATPIPKGDVAMSVNGGASGIVTPGNSEHVPQLEFGLRYGLSDYADIGVSTGFLSLTSDVNFALINSESFALSVDPTIHMLYLPSDTGSAFWAAGRLPVLMDVVKTDSITLVTGAGMGFLHITADNFGDEALSGSGTGLMVVGTAGAKIRVTEGFAIMPSVDIQVFTEQPDSFLYRAGLGLHF